jgi:lipid-A-disaccharide synthase
MIVAGEASGDQHGAKLVAAMRQINPHIFFCGIGGKALAAAGVRILIDAALLSVVGITEVIAKLPLVQRSLAMVKNVLRSLKPDLLILIDFPDFNLRVAASARKLGIPVLYYISPQIWAWRRGRVNKIRKLVDHMAVILPFEADFYTGHGIPVTFVGHPLLDGIAENQRASRADGLAAEPTLIGLLPGSREVEIKRLLPVMVAAAESMHRKNPRLTFAVSVAPTVEKTMLEALIKDRNNAVPIHAATEPVERLLERCRLVVAASGTVTLQAAIAGVPMVIVYKVSPISYWIGKALIRVDHIGLINLIAGRRLAPELIQDQVTPANIADRALALLADADKCEQVRKDLLAAGRTLGARELPGERRKLRWAY